MGADVSSEQPQRYHNASSGQAQQYHSTSGQRKGFASDDLRELAQKYRERFGTDIPDDVIEQYKIAKLKSDLKKRQEQAENNGNTRKTDLIPREDDDYYTRKKHEQNRTNNGNSTRKRDDDDYYARKKQEENLRIMQKTYERSKRDQDRRHRSSRERNGDEHGRSRRHQSPKDHSRSRRSSSDSSTKENRTKHHSSRKSSEHKEENASQSTRNRTKNAHNERHSTSSKHRDGSSSRRSSLDSSTKENRRKQRSSKKSPENREDKSSRHSHSTEDKSRKKSSSNYRSEKQSSSSRQRSSEKTRDKSYSEDEKRDSKKKSNRENPKRSKKERSTKDDSAVIKRSKKKKSTKASHYQSAPDLTENDRQYGKGPWERTHSYFDEYGQQPQSWLREMSQERIGGLPAPVMERQIIYGIPAHSVPAVDGLGYPLRERSPGFHPVPYQTYLLNKPTRPRSMDLSSLPTSLGPMSSPVSSVQPNTMIRLPPGAVPAVGPMASSPNSAQVATGSPVQPVIMDSNTIIPQRGYEVQAHLPTNMSSTLPSKFRHRSNDNASVLPKYKTPPQYGNSLPERSDAPTPKPRTMSPTKTKSFDVTNTTRSSEHKKKKKSKITAISAREELEGMLAMDYDMSKVKGHGEFSEEFPPVFPGNYRANQAIFVDDVIFRQHPKIPDPESDTDSSDMMTDEDHVLTLGAQMSPNSPSYSSGFDLEIPEGFCFDSEGKEMSPERKKKTSGETKTPKVAKLSPKKGISETHKIKKSSAVDFPSNSKTNQRKTHKTIEDALVLTTIEPVTRSAKKSTSSDLRSPKQKNAGDKIIYPSKAVSQHATKTDSSKVIKMKNKRIQHPGKDDGYEKIITPSRNWVSEHKKQKTHDIGVGAKLKQKHKTIGVQTPKPKEAKPQPIYFLKPISSQEVFIEDSSIASRSETDMSQGQTVTSTSASNGSTTARSGQSWSRSSTYSSNTEHTNPSEVESARQNLQQKSRHLSNHKEEPQVAPSVASTDFGSEQFASVGPASMTLGVSESIQASSYTGRGGQVFCITRSKHEKKTQPIAQHSQNSQVVPLNTQPPTISQGRPSESDQDNVMQSFNPHQVGKWVLDCYAQDHKLSTQRERTQSEDEIVKTEPMRDSASPKLVHGELMKQNAADMTEAAPFENYSQDGMMYAPPVVTPLTTEALSRHEKNATTSWPKNRIEDASTDHSVDMTSDIGIFQKELLKSRQKIHEIQRSRSPEPAPNAEQYKNRLKQWNDSPTSNVVLAECCEVTDEDVEYSPRETETNKINAISGEPVGFSQNMVVADESDTESHDSEETASSNSSEEYTNPQVQLKNSLEHQSQPVGQGRMQNNQANSTNVETIDDFLNNFEKNSKTVKNPPKRPVNSLNIQNDDWRRVSSPKQIQPLPKIQPAQNMNAHISQQDPIVPRHITTNEIKPEAPHSEPLRLRTSSLATESDNTSCPSPVANPFNKMDNDEIESLVGKIPGRGSRDNTDLEKDVMAELEKARLSTKHETLEERTRRILGIRRTTLTDSENSDNENHSEPEKKKKDINSYMNDLLTGAADVSPASRQRYLASDLAKKNSKPQITSPLVTTHNGSKNTLENKQETPEVSSGESSSDVTDDETVTESFSVDVSDSVMGRNTECSVRIDQKNQNPTEYKIPDNVENGNPMSPSRGMMLSYGANIYAETPGFHKQEESSDSSEDDEPQVFPLENKPSHENQASAKTGLPRRVLDSPVPVSVNSPPLTDGEIDILKELVKNSSRTTSHASFDGMSSSGENSRAENGVINHNQSKPEFHNGSSSRELARQKIADSIGFTLDAQKSNSNQDNLLNSDEYDIKILSNDRNKNPTGNMQETENKKTVHNTMESLGIDPDDVTVFDV